jgi:hypothetical protein
MKRLPTPTTQDEMRGLLAHVIAGVVGGSASTWSRLVGPVERLPTWKFVRFNWRVTPLGSDEQQAIILKAVEIVRSANPYIN